MWILGQGLDPRAEDDGDEIAGPDALQQGACQAGLIEEALLRVPEPRKGGPDDDQRLSFRAQV
jgi:hypothetical protein